MKRTVALLIATAGLAACGSSNSAVKFPDVPTPTLVAPSASATAPARPESALQLAMRAMCEAGGSRYQSAQSIFMESGPGPRAADEVYEFRRQNDALSTALGSARTAGQVALAQAVVSYYDWAQGASVLYGKGETAYQAIKPLANVDDAREAAEKAWRQATTKLFKGDSPTPPSAPDRVCYRS